MPTINLLATASSVQGGDQFPIYSQGNGDARKVSASTLLQYVEDNFTSPGFTVAYVNPTVSGFVQQVPNNGQNTWLIIDPVSALAAGEIILPDSTVAADGQEILVSCRDAIAAFTINGAGSTVLGAPTGLKNNSSLKLRFNKANTTWYVVQAAYLVEPTGAGVFTTLTSSSTTTLNGTTIPASKTLVDTDSSQSLSNKSLVAPALGTPASGVLTNCTGLPLTSGITGTLAVANGGTGATAATGTGNVVLATSPTLVTPNIGVATATSVATSRVFGSVQSLSGAGAVDVVNYTTAFTSAGTADALTLADGAAGQIKNIVYVAEADGADTGVLTPTNFGNGTTITFNDVGDSCQLQFIGTDWWVISLNGAVVA
jgi:hypothetical protein